MNDKKKLKIGSLFYCRTPLQLKIVTKLIDILDLTDSSYLIYHPNKNTKKHYYYFDSFLSSNKFFIQSDDRYSFTFNESLAYWKLPKKIRKLNFKNIYFASLDSIFVSMMVANNITAKLYIFDDGLLNINQNDFYQLINYDHPLHKILKKILLIPNKFEILNNVSLHYTIYNTDLSSWMPCKSFKINLFDQFKNEANDFKNKKRLRVLLGNAFNHLSDPMTNLHDFLANSEKFDVFIPHPLSDIKFRVSKALDGLINEEIMENLIAEDIINIIFQNNFDVTVYGFSSSTLLNLSEHVKTVSILLHESLNNKLELDIACSLRNAGVRIISDDPDNSHRFSIKQFSRLASY